MKRGCQRRRRMPEQTEKKPKPRNTKILRENFKRLLRKDKKKDYNGRDFEHGRRHGKIRKVFKRSLNSEAGSSLKMKDNNEQIVTNSKRSEKDGRSILKYRTVEMPTSKYFRHYYIFMSVFLPIITFKKL